MSTAPPLSHSPPAGALNLPDTASPGLLLPSLSLARREWVRFLRQRHRVIGALATPVVFWLLIGGGIGSGLTFPGQPPGQSYLQFFFPGTVLMILLFTAIFSTISVIEDRREGFLQGVLVAPVSRQAIVLGKVLGGAALAFMQGVLFLLLSPLVGLHMPLMSWIGVIALMALLSFALTALGFAIAWPMTSTQGFHAIMNLFLLPMWFLSGALFPPTSAWAGIRWVMLANPLTYGLAGMRWLMLSPEARLSLHGPSLLTCFVVTLVFMIGLFGLCVVVARKTGPDV